MTFYLKSGFTTLAAAATFASMPVTTMGAQSTSEVRSNGTATVTVGVDLAVVTIQYSAGGRTPAIAGRTAAARANAIRAAIVALGVPRDSMPSNGRQAWGWLPNRSEIQVRNNMRDTSYVTRDEFTVRVRDLTLIGRVIDTAMVEGAQTISNVQFEATNTEKESVEAIKKATAIARAHAQAVADASGMRLGRLLDVGIDAPPMMVSSALAMGGAMFDKVSAVESRTSVVAPELKVTATVSGRWEMVSPQR